MSSEVTSRGFLLSGGTFCVVDTGPALLSSFRPTLLSSFPFKAAFRLALFLDTLFAVTMFGCKFRGADDTWFSLSNSVFVMVFLRMEAVYSRTAITISHTAFSDTRSPSSCANLLTRGSIATAPGRLADRFFDDDTSPMTSKRLFGVSERVTSGAGRPSPLADHISDCGPNNDLQRWLSTVSWRLRKRSPLNVAIFPVENDPQLLYVSDVTLCLFALFLHFMGILDRIPWSGT
mmetsp:Transcript_22313/g.31101  ORF Transcript_22313/g.31101 Transcript_22313/m.31101 type:complete len:233 (-) Transcript_22313:547-1245(-)